MKLSIFLPRPVIHRCLLILLIVFIGGNARAQLSKKLIFFIQGYYIGNGLMTPALFNEYEKENHNPNLNPYTLSDVSFVTIDLHDPSTFMVVSSYTGILKTDGSIVCAFSGTAGNYYLSIENSNAIYTWSSLPVLIGSSSDPLYISSPNFTFDFSQLSTRAYSDGINLPQTLDYFCHTDASGSQCTLGNLVSDNKWKLYSGDIVRDRGIDALDWLAIKSQSGNAGILAEDLNGDGAVDLLDVSVVVYAQNRGVFAAYP